MLGELPAPLDNSGKTDTLLKLRVGDDLIEHSEFLRSITLKVLLSDSSTLKLDQNQTIEKAMVTDFWGVPKLFNSPPRKGIEEITQVLMFADIDVAKSMQIFMFADIDVVKTK